MEKRILVWEPCFFMFFGLFHLHRIWGLIDRNSYAAFWIGVLESRGLFYFILMGILAILCILGMITFVQNLLLLTASIRAFDSPFSSVAMIAP